MATTIIKAGDISKRQVTRTFDCPVCGCKFEATYDTYELLDLKDRSAIHAEAACICPTCGEPAYDYTY